MCNDFVEVFDNKRAAPVDFTGYPGYAHMQPFYIEDSEGEEDHQDDGVDVVEQQVVVYGHDFGGSSSGNN